MLTQKIIDNIKSSVPILKEKGTEITTIFYKNMLEENPDIKIMFNLNKQKDGSQPKALANIILAAAENIDNLSILMPAVESIAKTHTNANVRKEHYSIVGKYLLEAIKEVLGDQATNELMSAWNEVYSIIANIFINVEKSIYNNELEYNKL